MKSHPLVPVEESRVPSVTIDLGGAVVNQAPYVARGIQGVKNILATLGMIAEPASLLGRVVSP